MSRPAVSVVMPFAGTAVQAGAALDALAALDASPGDELILADNSGTAVARDGVHVVRAAGERSPAHARNAGAALAHADWLLFLDADCRAPADLLARFFTEPIAADVGALAGAVAPAAGARGPAARYGAARSFLDQDAHLAHPYLPRAVAANLLVRRAAFAAVGGFCEGVRAAEDTDFSWRLQRAGWRLEGRPGAAVEHRYRATVRGLRRQWRGYAAGRAWLARRYEGFTPEPALARAARRALGRRRPLPPAPSPPPASPPPAPPPAALAPPAATPHPAPERVLFAALDALLGVEELVGFALSNRPPRRRRAPARVVVVAERFPDGSVPAPAGARVEAAARPAPTAAPAGLPVDHRAPAGVTVDYREDDGAAARALALAWLLARHPLRCARDPCARGPGAPGLAALAPAVLRLRADADGARLRSLGGTVAVAVAVRLARLSGRALEP